MKKLFITLILIFIVFPIFSQVDSLEKQILTYDDSKSVIIAKGRNLLLNKFLENDVAKVKEIKNYLIEKCEDDNHIAFYLAEYWFILYWTNEYEELANSITTFGSIPNESFYSNYYSNYSQKIAPPQDMLYAKLKSKSTENEYTLIHQIQSADIDIEMKEFLQLNFESMIKKSSSFQDTLNKQADNFMHTYPESEYNNFTKQYIKFKLVPKNWGIAGEFFSGYGILTGVLKDNFKNNIPLGVAFDICYKRFELYLRDYIGFNKTKVDLDYSIGTYEKGSSAMVFLPEASLGYAALDKDRFKLAPFAGIGGINICPPLGKTAKIPELNEVSVSAFTCNFGANFDVKFGKKDYSFRPKASYGFLRIRYGFCLAIKRNEGILGNTHYITVGFGGFSRGLKREY